MPQRHESYVEEVVDVLLFAAESAAGAGAGVLAAVDSEAAGLLSLAVSEPGFAPSPVGADPDDLLA
jgi:hypothetical protein